MQKTIRGRQAFSWLEVVATVAIVGVIGAIIIARFTTTPETAKDELNEDNQELIEEMVDRYHAENHRWPSPDLQELEDPDYLPDGIPVSPYDGITPYTLDESTHEVLDVPHP